MSDVTLAGEIPLSDSGTASRSLNTGRGVFLGGLTIGFGLAAGYLVHPIAGLAVGLFAVTAYYWTVERALIAFLISSLLWPYKLAWDFGPWQWMPARIFIVLMFFVWVVALLRRDIKLERTPLDLAILIFTLVMMASLAASSLGMTPDQFNRGLKNIGYSVGEWFLLFYMVTTIARNWKLARKFLVILVSITTVIAIVGIIEYLTGFRVYEWVRQQLPGGHNMMSNLHEYYLENGGGGMWRGDITRIVSTTISPHEVGTLMAVTIPLLFYFLSYARRLRIKLLCGAAILLEASALMLTVTRGAIIAAVLAVIVLSLLSHRGLLRAGIMLMSVMSMMVILLFPAIPAAFFDVSDPAILHTETSLQGRFSDWPQAAALLNGNEFLGIGVGQITGHTIDASKVQIFSHFSVATDNWYLAATTETGYLGLASIALLWLAVVVMLLRKSPLGGQMGREARDMRIAILAGSVAFMFMCFSFDAMVFMTVSKNFFVMAGLGWALFRGERALAQRGAKKLP